jgi:hypothetical protein
VPSPAGCAPTFLQLGLVDTPSAAHESFPDTALDLPDRLVVTVIELFDDLKRPPAVKHVASDDVVEQPGGSSTYPARRGASAASSKRKSARANIWWKS